MEISDFKILEPKAQTWIDTIANVRIHGATHEKPIKLFELEKVKLKPLPINRYNVSVTNMVRVNKCFRVTLDTNRYSVPYEYAGQLVQLARWPKQIRIYHDNQLIAQHVRSFDRRRDFENPDHVVELLKQKRKARKNHQLQRFLMLSAVSESYYGKLQERRFNVGHHVEKILALSEIYGQDKTARALKDSYDMEAISCEYIANLLEQREKRLPEPGALHLTRREDLLELELPMAQMDQYESIEQSSQCTNNQRLQCNEQNNNEKE